MTSGLLLGTVAGAGIATTPAMATIWDLSSVHPAGALSDMTADDCPAAATKKTDGINEMTVQHGARVSRRSDAHFDVVGGQAPQAALTAVQSGAGSDLILQYDHLPAPAFTTEEAHTKTRRAASLTTAARALKEHTTLHTGERIPSFANA